MVCLVYAIIGIPLNAILIGSLGSVFSNKESIFGEISINLQIAHERMCRLKKITCLSVF